MIRFPCNPFLAIVGIGAVTMGATIALHDGTTQRIMPEGWRERPALVRPYARPRAAVAAVPVIVWGECWYWAPFLDGPAWGFTPPGGFGNYGGGYGSGFSGGGYAGDRGIGAGVGAGPSGLADASGAGSGVGAQPGPDAAVQEDHAGAGDVTEVPEPASLASVLLALGAVLVLRRRP